jgi:hypothetical protein
VKAGDAGWGSPTAVLPLLGAVVLYAVFAAVERASRSALMDTRCSPGDRWWRPRS